MNTDTIGYVWTGEYDLNTLRVDGEIFKSATKKLRIRKYPYTCLGPVHTYPDIFESGYRYGYRPHVSGEFDSESEKK